MQDIFGKICCLENFYFWYCCLFLEMINRATDCLMVDSLSFLNQIKWLKKLKAFQKSEQTNKLTSVINSSNLLTTTITTSFEVCWHSCFEFFKNVTFFCGVSNTQTGPESCTQIYLVTQLFCCNYWNVWVKHGFVRPVVILKFTTMANGGTFSSLDK